MSTDHASVLAHLPATPVQIARSTGMPIAAVRTALGALLHAGQASGSLADPECVWTTSTAQQSTCGIRHGSPKRNPSRRGSKPTPRRPTASERILPLLPATGSYIREALGITRAGVSFLLTRLRKAGQVERHEIRGVVWWAKPGEPPTVPSTDPPLPLPATTRDIARHLQRRKRDVLVMLCDRERWGDVVHDATTDVWSYAEGAAVAQ